MEKILGCLKSVQYMTAAAYPVHVKLVMRAVKHRSAKALLQRTPNTKRYSTNIS